MRPLRDIWRRIRIVFRQRQFEADIEEELRFHVEMKARDYREAGMPEREALQAARRQFGNATRVREESREAWAWSAIERTWQDFRLSFRRFRKEPAFTTVAVLTLAFGIGATTAVFSVINGVLLRPLPYEAPDRLFAVFQNRKQSGAGRTPTSYLNFRDWRDQSRSFERMTYVSIPLTVTVTEPQADVFAGAGVEREYFKTLGVRAALGRLLLPADFQPGADPAVVLTWSAWQTRFGADKAIVGRKLRSGAQSRTIVGVLPPDYRRPRLDNGYKDPEILIPLDLSRLLVRDAGVVHVIGRLRAGVSAGVASAEMAGIGRRLAAQYPENRGVDLETASLTDLLTGKMKRPLYLLLGGVLVLLLCACVNMANLLLARSIQRRQEFAIRAALGGRRGLLFRQVIVEGLALSGAGAVLGVVAASTGVRWMLMVAGQIVPRADLVRVDSTVLLFTLAVACLTGLLFAGAPAFACSRTDLSEPLRSGGRGGETGSLGRARSALVTAEVALSVFLLSGAGLLVRSYWRVLKIDMGCETSNVVTADLNLPANPPSKPIGLLAQLMDRAAAMPGVESAGAAATIPLALSPTPELSISIRNRPAPAGVGPRTASVLAATPDYFRAMRIALRRGRFFDSSDAMGKPAVALVNEAFVRRFLPKENPIGYVLEIGGGSARNIASGDAEIVGVVADVRQNDLLAEPAPQVWKPHAQCPWPYMSLAIRSAGNAALGSALRRELRALDRSIPLTNIRSADSFYADALAHRRLSLLLTGTIAGLAVIMSAIGVYGVVSYAVTRRRREIGIRMALGAQPGGVVAMVVRQGLGLAAAGLAVGIIAALAAARLLAALLYGIQPQDPLTFCSVGLLFSAIAAAAAFFPGRKATRIDPLTALRAD